MIYLDEINFIPLCFCLSLTNYEEETCTSDKVCLIFPTSLWSRCSSSLNWSSLFSCRVRVNLGLQQPHELQRVGQTLSSFPEWEALEKSSSRPHLGGTVNRQLEKSSDCLLCVCLAPCSHAFRTLARKRSNLSNLNLNNFWKLLKHVWAKGLWRFDPLQFREEQWGVLQVKFNLETVLVCSSSESSARRYF